MFLKPRDWKGGKAVAERSGAMQAKAGTLQSPVFVSQQNWLTKMAQNNKKILDKTQNSNEIFIC